MLATAGPLPPDDGRWSYELKWDGVRALVAVEGGTVALRSRVGNDITGGYPELAGVRCREDALLDGEVVALDEQGRPDFGLLQSRMHVRAPAAALRAQVPVHLVVFDVLHVGATSLLQASYDERRGVLAGLAVEGAQLSEAYDGDGAVLLETTRQAGLEGVVSKRRDSRYLPGRRSDDWVKTKNVRTQSAVVIGWKPGEGGRSATLGSLLLAVTGPGGLEFAGHVGTGFTQATLRQLVALLAPLATGAPPCPVPREHARVARWVRPELVVDVEHTAWTREGRLRHPSYQGLRDDVPPDSVVREGP